jgi:hypothetical protein
VQAWTRSPTPHVKFSPNAGYYGTSIREIAKCAARARVEDVDNGYRGARQGMNSRGLASTEAAGPALKANRSDMTEPEKEDPLGRANELESIVDDLDEKVADEREAEGVPGKPSDRENAATRVSENEPPD